MLRAKHYILGKQIGQGKETYKPGDLLPEMAAEIEDRLIKAGAAVFETDAETRRRGDTETPPPSASGQQSAAERKAEDAADARKLGLFELNGSQVTFVRETTKRVYYLDAQGVECWCTLGEWKKAAQEVNSSGDGATNTPEPPADSGGQERLELPEGVNPDLIES